MSNLTPREIVSELDRYIVGQTAAKRAVAIALRNRWRRQQVHSGELRDEITPKNIILIGPTGVGKTEIARRLARLAQAPFVKVEASKFTEVGYVGRDVESMVRDLVEASLALVREEEDSEGAHPRARAAEDRLVSAAAGRAAAATGPVGVGFAAPSDRPHVGCGAREAARAAARRDARRPEVEMDVAGRAGPAFLRGFSGQGMEEMGVNLAEMFKSIPACSGRAGAR